MTPLEMALAELARLGYEANHIYTFPVTRDIHNPLHVYLLGRHNNRHTVLVLEDRNNGSYRFFLPVYGDLGQQLGTVAERLNATVERLLPLTDEE